MIPNASTIVAQVLKATAPKGTRQRGVVERRLDSSTYVIRLATGRVTAKVETGSLALEQAVQVSRHGDQLEIVPMPQPAAGDSVVLSQPAGEHTPDSHIRQTMTAIDTLLAERQQSTKPHTDLGEVLTSLRHSELVLKGEPRHTAQALGKSLAELAELSSSTQTGSSDRLVALLRAAKQQLADIHSALQRTVKLSLPAQEGFMRFDSTAEALAWIAEQDPEAEIPAGRKLDIPAREPVIVRTFVSEQKVSEAAILDRSRAAAEIDRFLHNELHSPLWKHVSTEAVLEAIETRGAVAAEHLHDIDRALVRDGSALQLIATRRPEELAAVVKQWLGVVLDTPESASSLASSIPLESASDIPQLLEQLSRLLIAESRQTAPRPSTEYSLVESSVQSSQPPREAIVQLVERLGFTYEHDLATQPAALEKAADSGNLKHILRALIAQSAGPEPTELRAAATQSAPDQAEALALAETAIRRLLAHTETQSTDITDLLQKIDAHAPRQTAEQIQSIRAILHELIEVLARSADTLAVEQSLARHPGATPLPHAEISPPPSESLPPSAESPPPSSDAPPPPSTETTPPPAVRPEPAGEPAPQIPVRPPATESQPGAVPAGAPALNPIAHALRPVIPVVERAAATVPHDLHVLAQRAPERAREMVAVLSNKAKDLVQLLQSTLATLREHAGGSSRPTPTEAPVQTPQTAAGPPPVQPPVAPQESSSPAAAPAPPSPAEAQGGTVPEMPRTESIRQVEIQLRNALDGIRELAQTMESSAAERNTGRPRLYAESAPITNLRAVEHDLARTVAFVSRSLQTPPASESPAPGVPSSQPPPQPSVEPSSAAAAAPRAQPVETDGRLIALRQVLELLSRNTDRTLSAVRAAFQAAPGASQTVPANSAEPAMVHVENLIQQIVASIQAARAAAPTGSSPGTALLAAIVDRVREAFAPLGQVPQEIPDQRPAMPTIPPPSPNAVAGELTEVARESLEELSREVAQALQSAEVEQVPAAAHQRTPQAVQATVELLQRVSAQIQTQLATVADTAERIPQQAVQQPEALRGLLASFSDTLESLQPGGRQSLSEIIGAAQSEMTSSSPGGSATAPSAPALARAVEALLSPIVESTHAAMRQAVSEAGEALGAVQESAREPQQTPQQILREGVTRVQDMIRQLGADMETAIREATARVRESAQPPAQTPGTPSPPNGPSPQTILSELVSQLQSRVQQTLPELQRVLEETGQRADTAGIQQREAEEHLARAMREIQGRFRELHNRLEQVAREPQRLSDPSLLEGIRRQAENTLARLESLQLLAKPTSVNEGEQQILALPIRLDNEWSEVQVRLIRRGGGKRTGKKRDHYSVVVDVAPTYAGGVTAQMDYAEKRGLVLNMEFAKGAARTWFEQNRTEFAEAIRALGFRSVDIRFRTARRSPSPVSGAPRSRDDRPRDNEKTAEIDIKI